MSRLSIVFFFYMWISNDILFYKDGICEFSGKRRDGFYSKMF